MFLGVLYPYYSNQFSVTHLLIAASHTQAVTLSGSVFYASVCPSNLGALVKCNMRKVCQTYFWPFHALADDISEISSVKH